MNPINPNLSDEINKNILDSELKGGVWLKDVQEGQRIIVRTKNTRYIIDRLPKADMIFGNEKYCPHAREVQHSWFYLGRFDAQDEIHRIGHALGV